MAKPAAPQIAGCRRFLKINRAPSDVWAAWTKPHHLQTWLCDEALVDPRQGKKWDLRGESFFRGQVGRIVVLEVRAERLLQLSLELGGRETLLTVVLEPAEVKGSVTERTPPPCATLLTLAHEPVAAAGGGSGQLLLLDHFWSLYLSLLKRYLDWNEIPDRASLADEAAASVTHSLEVGASAEEVFNALLDPARLDQWIATRAEVEPEVGGRYSFGWTQGPQRILELDSPRRLVFDWNEEGMPGKVEWRLETPEPTPQSLAGSDASGHSRCRVTVVHSGLPGGPRKSEVFREYNETWLDILVSLDLYLRSGIAPANWSGRGAAPIRRSEPRADAASA